jgi:hypothetical protein
MDPSIWEELLGNSAKYVRGALLISMDGQILTSTMPHGNEALLNTRHIANLLSKHRHQLDIKTEYGWLLAAPFHKQYCLVIVIESGPYIRFNLDLVKLFSDEDDLDDDSNLAVPTIIPQPPKQDSACVLVEFDEYD